MIQLTNSNSLIMMIFLLLQVLLSLLVIVNSESTTEIIKVYTKLGLKKGSKGNSICTDSKGSIYITGTIKNITNSITNDDDVFLIKYTATGRKPFIKISGSTSPDISRGIACDSNTNSIYIVGFTYGNLGIIIIINYY